MKNYLLTKNVEIKECSDGGTIFHMQDKSNDIKLTRYNVFSGIDLIYNNINSLKFSSQLNENKKNIIEIDHCHKGYLEYQIQDKYFYISPGDISIHQLGKDIHSEIFPNGHYQGITIQIDIDKAPENFSDILEDINVSPLEIAEKFHLKENFFFILRQFPNIEHIFSELYNLPSCAQKGYFKLKILEIFLFLSSIETPKNKVEQHSFSASQAECAKNICKYLNEHLEKNITMSSLSDIFNLSDYQIRTSFYNVYGMTVSTYLRHQRMQKAAQLLRSSNLSILEIANQVGYNNGSKFAESFRIIMGMTPRQYRNEKYRNI